MPERFTETLCAASEAGWSHYRIDDGGPPMQLPYSDKLPIYIGPPVSRSGRPPPANSQIIAGHQSVIPVVRPRTDLGRRAAGAEKPPILPPVAKTLWQGMIRATGFFAMAS